MTNYSGRHDELDSTCDVFTHCNNISTERRNE